MKKIIEFLRAYMKGEEAELEITLEWYDLVTIVLIMVLLIVLLIKL